MMRSITIVASLAALAVASPARADHQLNGVNMNGVNMNGVNMNGVNMNGVNMNGVNMNGVTLGNISADASLDGNLLSVNIIDVASSCAHSQLATGAALPGWCSPCAQAVENVLPYCGSWGWDAACVQQAQVSCRPSGAALVGATFSATMNDGTPVQLYLSGVRSAPLHFKGISRVAAAPEAGIIRFGSDVNLYTFSYRRLPRSRFGRPSPWYPLCDNTDRDGLYNMAVAVPGTWADCSGPGCGGRISAAGFALSCTDKGAIAKCIERMGYKPWKTATTCDRQGNCHDVSLEPYLEACVRMVRADYCGDGTPHTQDGTAIDVYDNVSLESRDTTIDWFPEALWTPAGAACMSNYRIIDPSTGAPFGDIINSSSCYHHPYVSESSNIMCGLPDAVSYYPGTYGGMIGDRSSMAGE